MDYVLKLYCVSIAMQRWITAVHEASHAVAAHELRHNVAAVTIVQQGIALGSTSIPTIGDWQDMKGDEFERSFMRRYRNRKRGSLAIYIAGDVGNTIDGKTLRPPVSERVPPGIFDCIMNQGWAAPGVHEMDDVKRAIELSLECWDDPMEEIRKAERRVDRILRAHWPKTLRLARLLMEKNSVRGSILTTVLSQNKWKHIAKLRTGQRLNL